MGIKILIKTILILCIGFTTCSFSQKNIIGTYKSSMPSTFYVFFHKGHYSTGSVLTLHADSTFIYNICGNILQGVWQVQNDSLLITILTNMYKHDSSVHHTNSVQKFYVDGGVLIHRRPRSQSIQNGKYYYGYDLLKKEN